MLRKLPLLAGLLLVFALSAGAQGIVNKVELFGGYSYMRYGTSPSTNLNGWELSGLYKVNHWLGGVADFGGTYGSDVSVHTFLFGPQVSWPTRISPFAHVLLGAARFGGPHFGAGGSTDTSFSAAAGVGIDSKLTHGISWRVIQGEYLTTRFFGSTQTSARVSTGIVIRF